ncbi:hypothetical protein EDB87DRAFT_1581588 [Lactarius vividus]|nr:hypothetical protein EDB87DRAFT_1581588 [Lactarius vividus]
MRGDNNERNLVDGGVEDCQLVQITRPIWTQSPSASPGRSNPPFTSIIRIFYVQNTFPLSAEMEHRQIISNVSGSSASRPSGMSTQIAESQGSQSQPISVGLTVIRARNIPHIKTTFGRKREFFVTIAYGETTKKTKKQTEKRTKSVHIDRLTAVWDQELERLTKSDILVGTHEMGIPDESESNVSVTLGDGNGQAGQSTPPVTLDLIITVSGKTGKTSPQDRGEMSLVERARIDLDRADEVEKSIDQSKTWEGVVGKIKWVMDTLNPVAEMAYKVLSVIPVELSKQYQRDNNVRTLLKSMHDAFDFANHEDTLKSIKPKSKQADVLALMLRN